MDDSLGDRMKRYEAVAHHSLAPRLPVIIRLDGRCFTRYTRNCIRPFDRSLRDAMVVAARKVAEDMQGFKAGYHQSDEVSFLLTDYEQINTSPYFDYDQQKLVSVTASLFAAIFNQRHASLELACFDARAFNVPREDVSNYFLWRARDWQRNSLSMYCRSFFSHKQLHEKKRADMHEMLHGIGKNWSTDLEPEWRNGSFFFPDNYTRSDIQPSYAEVSAIIEPQVYPLTPQPSAPPSPDTDSSSARAASPCPPSPQSPAPA